jgi:hypothetical protein
MLLAVESDNSGGGGGGFGSKLGIFVVNSQCPLDHAAALPLVSPPNPGPMSSHLPLVANRYNCMATSIRTLSSLLLKWGSRPSGDFFYAELEPDRRYSP